MYNVVVSIIIPVFNAEKYLHKCIISIINQNYKNFELILVNDGSQDKSGEICDFFSEKDVRIKVIHKNNEGVSIARNTGIEKSEGKYIMFADADDYVERNWCEDLINMAEKNKNALIINSYIIKNFRNDKEQIIIRSFNSMQKNIEKIKKADFLLVYKSQLLNSPCNKIFSSEIIKENNIRFRDSLNLGEDLLFTLDYLVYSNNNIMIINKPSYNYILRNTESLDNKYYPDLFNIYKSIYKEIYMKMLLFNSDLEKYNIYYYNSFLIMLDKALNNNLSDKSDCSLANKIQKNNQILKSPEFRLCLEYARVEDFNKFYLMLLKSEKYSRVYIFKEIIKFKMNIFKRLFKVN
ncbi:glycosyltransferase [Sutcliffiella horikoshii]|uniref:glycosyltransferase family 2 protein n=1 Tax=Sutcliffiella horikoshii TaxID=79883 RepID=UPI001CC0166E|nr:glycosyltransferase family 2 protein [Sutcliffiella horikoshii]UAL46931.1 glycosyltransferase [Sutcliffiella horikoshii]